MLKFQLDEEGFNGLDEPVREFYEKADDGYRLKLDGYEDPVELKRAKDREVQARKEATEKNKDLEAKLEELKNNHALKNGDVETLHKSHQERENSLKSEIEKLKADHQAELDGRDKALLSSETDSLVTKLSADFFGDHAALGNPHLAGVVQYVLEDGKPVAKMKTKEGVFVNLDEVELKKQFLEDKTFEDIMVGSKARGSADVKPRIPQGGAEKKTPYNQLTKEERIARVTAKRKSQKGA